MQIYVDQGSAAVLSFIRVSYINIYTFYHVSKSCSSCDMDIAHGHIQNITINCSALFHSVPQCAAVYTS